MKSFKRIFLILLLSFLFLSGCTFNDITNLFKKSAPDLTESKVRPGEAGVLDVVTQEIEGNIEEKESNTNAQTMPEQIATQATFKTNLGDFVVKFYTEDAPKTVANFTKLASEGFYNGVRFHRVIKDFMIQGGDPLSKELEKKNVWGTGGPGFTFEDEINEHKLVKGILAMANSGPNTNGSQFFIITAENTPWLDGKHTAFGEVIVGMNIVEIIGNVETDSRDRPIKDVIIEDIDLVITEFEETEDAQPASIQGPKAENETSSDAALPEGS